MKKTKILLLFVAGSFASCGEKDSSESANSSSLDFTVEIDTVQVDPGEDHFIYLSNYLNTASLSSDKKLLYNFNPKVPELEVIDLDELTITEIIKLENEGPTGINAANSYMPMMAVSDSGELFLNSWSYMIKLNAAKDKMSRYWFTADSLKGEPLSEMEKVYPEGFISNDGNSFIGTYGPQDNRPKSGLAIVNLKSMELKKVPMDIFEKIEKYAIVFSPEENSKMSITESVFFQAFQDKILISSTAFNEIYSLDPSDGAIESHSYHSELTDDFKEGDYEKRAKSQENLFELNKGKMKEVTFSKFHYDDQNQKFWRFSRDMDRMIGDSIIYKNVLTIFDKNLNQLHEEKVEYFETGALTFFKDGTLYIFINLEDELGFVRIKPTYE